MRAAILILALTLSAQAWTGAVVRVLDGDTFDVLRNGRTVRVRLYGVDCPEKTQAFGQAAKKFSIQSVGGRTVEVDSMDSDRYGRTVGILRLPGAALTHNQALLQAGYAWFYAQYCKAAWCPEWSASERAARVLRVGLWGGEPPLPPWEFRRR